MLFWIITLKTQFATSAKGSSCKINFSIHEKKKLSKIMLKTTPVLKLFIESFTSWADSNSDGQGMLQNKQRHYHLHR